MDIATILDRLVNLDIRDRIWLVQRILDSIATDLNRTDLTTAQKQELDRRIDDCQANIDDVMTWAEVKDSIDPRS